MSGESATRVRRAFIERFAALCAEDERVAAVFLSGSYASGDPDEFSDVDLMLVAADSAYEALFEDRWRIMGRLGELVLADDFDGFGRDMLLYLYADGVDGEVDLHRRSTVSWAHPSRLFPLVDKDAVAADVRAWPTPERAERARRISHIFNRFWRHVWLGAGALGRSRSLTAHYYLEGARVCCINLMRLRHDISLPWAFSGYDKAEHVLTEVEQAALAATFVPLEQSALTAGLVALLHLFEPLAAELAAREKLTRPTGLAAVARGRLDHVVAGR